MSAPMMRTNEKERERERACAKERERERESERESERDYYEYLEKAGDQGIEPFSPRLLVP